MAQPNFSQANSEGESAPAQSHAHVQVNLNATQLLKFCRRAIVFTVPAFAFVLGIHQITGGWDDGEITAAFSRTLAETGRFALTPLSERVEGVSSLAWTFLLTLPYYLFQSTQAILVWMKLLAAGSFLLTLILFWRLALQVLKDEVLADISTILLALMVPPMLETLNGMEMNLYMVLALLLVSVLMDVRPVIHKPLWIWTLTAALVLTRFEAPFLLATLVLSISCLRDRRSCFQLATATGTSFLVTELWRFHVFGEWMPNTVYAKMHEPYSPPHVLARMLEFRFATVLEMLAVFGLPLLALLIGAVAMYVLKQPLVRQAIRWRPGAFTVLLSIIQIALAEHFYPQLPYLLSKNRTLVFAGCGLLLVGVAASALSSTSENPLAALATILAVACIAFGMIFGRNWGYNGRMFVVYLPFLVLSAAYAIKKSAPSKYWGAVALATCVLVQMPVWSAVAQLAWLQGDTVPAKNVERTGLAVDAVRQLIHSDSLSILTPDMGASSLCCEHLRMEDSGLLTNAYLARRGYGFFEEYLRAQSPEVIETHGAWSQYSGVYRSELMKDYNVVVVGEARLLLRNDVYAHLYSELQRTTGIHVASGAACFGGIEHSSLDESFVLAKATCLYIPANDLSTSPQAAKSW